jgi:hypothetical protein
VVVAVNTVDVGVGVNDDVGVDAGFDVDVDAGVDAGVDGVVETVVDLAQPIRINAPSRKTVKATIKSLFKLTGTSYIKSYRPVSLN